MHYLSPLTCYVRFLFISDQSLRHFGNPISIKSATEAFQLMAASRSYFFLKTLAWGRWSGWGLNPGPPARQTIALPTGLTGRVNILYFSSRVINQSLNFSSLL